MICRPPRFARWLLLHLAPEALAGDLTEEFKGGRSAAWYWRQTMSAVGHVIATDVVAHPLLPVRAVASGWIVLAMLTAVQKRLVDWIDWLLLPNLTRWNASWLIDHHIWAVYRVVLWFGVMLGAGWLVGCLHRRRRAAAVLIVTAAYTLQTAYYVALTALDANLWAMQPPFSRVLLTDAVYVLGLVVGGIALTAAPEPLLTTGERRS